MSESNHYVVIRDHSAGNDTVGDMWKETKIFSGDTSLDEVMKWAVSDYDWKNFGYSRRNITITMPHGGKA